MDSLKSGELTTLATVLERGNTSPKVGPAVAITYTEVAPLNGKLDKVAYLKAALYRGVGVDGDAEFSCRYKEWLSTSHRLRIGDETYSITHLYPNKRKNSMLLLLKLVTE